MTLARRRWVYGVPNVAGEVQRPPGCCHDIVRTHLAYDAAPTFVDDTLTRGKRRHSPGQ